MSAAGAGGMCDPGLSEGYLSCPADFDIAFKEASARTSGVAVLSGPLIFAQREAVVAAAARHKVPAIYYDADMPSRADW